MRDLASEGAGAVVDPRRELAGQPPGRQGLVLKNLRNVKNPNHIAANERLKDNKFVISRLGSQRKSRSWKLKLTSRHLGKQSLEAFTYLILLAVLKIDK